MVINVLALFKTLTNSIRSLPNFLLIGGHDIINELSKYEIPSNFDNDIQEALIFYAKNFERLNSLQSVEEMGFLLELIKKTDSVKGDILELGSYDCGTTIMLAHFLKSINSKKHVFGCDTFSGLPYEDKFSTKSSSVLTFFMGLSVTSSDTIIGRYKASFDSVIKKITEFGLNDTITLIKGKFEDTLESELGDKRFSFVFNDCDLYDATKFCLKFIWPRLEKKGIIAFDEYGKRQEKYAWGEIKAVEEFCLENNINLINNRKNNKKNPAIIINEL